MQDAGLVTVSSRTLNACLLLGLCLTLFPGCEKPEAGPVALPEVLVTSVVQRDVPVYAEGIGTTSGYVDAQIRAKVQGYLLSRNYTEGSFVKAGSLLFKIDPRSYQASYDQMKGEVGRPSLAGLITFLLTGMEGMFMTGLRLCGLDYVGQVCGWSSAVLLIRRGAARLALAQ